MPAPTPTPHPLQRAYDIQDAAAAGPGSRLPASCMYDRLARTSFWVAVLLATVMGSHLATLAVLLWRRAWVPSMLWFPRAELLVCIAVLPALAWGEAGEPWGAAGERAGCGAFCSVLWAVVLRFVVLLCR